MRYDLDKKNVFFEDDYNQPKFLIIEDLPNRFSYGKESSLTGQNI